MLDIAIPWWQCLLAILFFKLVFNIKINFNDLIDKYLVWIKNKNRNRKNDKCMHSFILYKNSEYSLCNKCDGKILTTVLNQYRNKDNFKIEIIVEVDSEPVIDENNLNIKFDNIKIK